MNDKSINYPNFFSKLQILKRGEIQTKKNVLSKGAPRNIIEYKSNLYSFNDSNNKKNEKKIIVSKPISNEQNEQLPFFPYKSDESNFIDKNKHSNEVNNYIKDIKTKSDILQKQILNMKLFITSACLRINSLKSENNDSSDIQNLEKKIKNYKEIYSNAEKKHINEISQLKILLNNSVVSSFVEIAEERKEQNEKNFNENLKKHEELNQLLNKLNDEIGYMKTNEKNKDEFLSHVKKGISKEYKEKEKKLIEILHSIQNEIAEKSGFDFGKKEISNKKKEEIQEKIILLEKKNKELENELENWKLNYWNLEKKLQYDSLMGSNDKYSENHIVMVLNQFKNGEEEKEKELRLKLEKLEKELGAITKKKKENNGKLKNFSLKMLKK